MPELPSTNLYESGMMKEITGATLRPGGIALTKRALEFCEFAPGSTILDIGCGSGETIKLLRDCGFQSYGLDKTCSSLLNLPHEGFYLNADGQDVPLHDGSMDGIIIECALSVIEHPMNALAEVNRLLKPGGLLILSDLYARNPLGIPPLRSTLSRGSFNSVWSQVEITSMIQNSGLTEVLWEDHSEAIRSIMGKIMFNHGSMDTFWCSLFQRDGSTMINPLNFQLLLTRAKIGYFLVIAQKPEC